MQLAFHRNIGNVDRIVRIIVGIILIYLAFFNAWALNSWVIFIIGLFGAVMIIEGALAY